MCRKRLHHVWLSSGCDHGLRPDDHGVCYVASRTMSSLRWSDHREDSHRNPLESSLLHSHALKQTPALSDIKNFMLLAIEMDFWREREFTRWQAQVATSDLRLDV